MKGSWKLARIQGIDVYVHWTFSILLIWIGLAHLWRGSHFMEAVFGIILVLAIFACVVLHEFGHALTARRFGIATADITLLPIGGVARLERMPRDPWQEFWVALAGPAVNVAIALGLLGYLVIARGLSRMPEDFFLPEQLVGGPLLLNLLSINIMLVVFNMLPAFPMDGGRVLRALLATRLDYVRATSIAASIGKAMALLMGIIGLFGSALLVLVAAFVYLGAEAESQMVQFTEALRGLSVRDAMMRHFRSLTPRDSLQVAADELLLGSQRDFPVVDNDKAIGIVRQSAIVRGIRDGGLAAPVTAIMEPTVPIAASTSLEEVARTMHQDSSLAIPVVEHDQVVGMLSLENIGELVMIRSAIAGREDAPFLANVIPMDRGAARETISRS